MYLLYWPSLAFTDTSSFQPAFALPCYMFTDIQTSSFPLTPFFTSSSLLHPVILYISILLLIHLDSFTPSTLLTIHLLILALFPSIVCLQDYSKTTDSMKDGRMGYRPRKNPLNVGTDLWQSKIQDFLFLSLKHCEINIIKIFFKHLYTFSWK